MSCRAFLNNEPIAQGREGQAGAPAGPTRAGAKRMSTSSGNIADIARALPFIGLLLTIALAPLLAPRLPGIFAYIGWARMCLVPWLLLVGVIFFARALTTLPG